MQSSLPCEVSLEEARVQSNLSLCSLSLSDATAALDHATAAASADPSFAKAHARKAAALAALGRTGEVRAALRRSQKERALPATSLLGYL